MSRKATAVRDAARADPDLSVRTVAALTLPFLYTRPKELLQEIEPGLASPDPAVRAAVFPYAFRSGGQSTATAGFLARALADRAPEVRIAAARHMETMRTSAVMSFLTPR